MSEEAPKDNLISDIFGDSDDENVPAPPASAATPAATAAQFLDSDDGSIFGDSDDDGAPAKKTNKLKKNSKALDELLDSDEEDAGAQRKSQFDKRKRTLTKGKKKDKTKSKAKDSERITKKARTDPKSQAQGAAAAEDGEGGDSGGEYDSGDEAVRTREDEQFIDEDDEHADLVREYDEDNTDFQDEAPLRNKKKASSHRPTSAGSTSGGRGKDTDPLSAALAELKAPKAKAMSAADMEGYVDKLQKAMARACAQDDDAYTKGQPATAKLALLPTVLQAVGMRGLHNTMLERDFLCNLRDWIRPRDAQTLPSLSVRTAVYNMLTTLPICTDHLKRVSSGEPIGFIIIALRKHKAETVANKRLLKDLIEKWSRPVFAASTGNGNMMSSTSDEVQRAMIAQYKEVPTGVQSGPARLDSLQAPVMPSDGSRVRMPTSVGYLFTVQPESKGAPKEVSLDEGRARLYKKTLDGKRSSGEAGAGKKANPRAISMSVSGRGVGI